MEFKVLLSYGGAELQLRTKLRWLLRPGRLRKRFRRKEPWSQSWYRTWYRAWTRCSNLSSCFQTRNRRFLVRNRSRTSPRLWIAGREQSRAAQAVPGTWGTRFLVL